MTTSEKAVSVGIAVMAKASAPGRTKTRLCPPLTGDEAAELNTSFLRDVAGNLLAAGRSARIAGYMAYGPEGSRPFFDAVMPDGIGFIESWIGDFGECLFHATTELFARGHAGACVLNADGPTLPTALLVRAAAALARPGDRAVIGPSDDGGYYLLGLKAPHRRLFEDIRWSTEFVADETLERAREIGLPVEILPAWYDVDDAATLRHLCDELASPETSRGGELSPYPAPHTRALLARLAAEPGFVDRIGAALPLWRAA